MAVGADGVSRNSLFVNWVSPNDAFVTEGGQIEVQYQVNGAAAWTEVGKFHGNITSCFIGNVSDTLEYNVQIRCINVGNYASEWAQVGPYTLSSVSSSISASAIVGLSGVATTGSASSITTGTISTSILPSVLARLELGGTAVSSIAAGATAQIGAGGTATVSGSGLAGSIALSTGTGTLASGVIATLTFPTTFATAPHGTVAANGVAIPGLSWSTSTTALTISAGAALSPSTAYNLGYSIS